MGDLEGAVARVHQLKGLATEALATGQSHIVVQVNTRLRHPTTYVLGQRAKVLTRSKKGSVVLLDASRVLKFVEGFLACVEEE